MLDHYRRLHVSLVQNRIGLELLELPLYDAEHELDRHILWRVSSIEERSKTLRFQVMYRLLRSVDAEVVHEDHRSPCAEPLPQRIDEGLKLLDVHRTVVALVVQYPVFSRDRSDDGRGFHIDALVIDLDVLVSVAELTIVHRPDSEHHFVQIDYKSS